MCRGVSHTPSMAGNLLSFGEMSYHSPAIYTLFPNIRAYAIRPYTCSFKTKQIHNENIISFPHVRADTVATYRYSISFK